MSLDTSSVVAWLTDFASVIHDNADLLTDLDREIGDGDHGSNMDRGMKAVAELESASFPTAADYLKKIGMTLVSTVGGASGPLYGTFFLRVGTAWGDAASAEDLGKALRAGLDGILARGKAEVGDKTMVDALTPALAAYDEHASEGIEAALNAAALACAAGRDATIPLVARKGRASYLGERSAGHQDPGATSVTFLIEAAARSLA
ncbi:MAG: dihydroxyacetone kinase subunit L [Propionibacteriaceae bacterium]|jgi:dihydroxyacetone kinase phosphoprotein-dependent L subunit|nr:dihydroxyacetone kinase subunit L [Propionibacteriaceae bacterium]